MLRLFALVFAFTLGGCASTTLAPDEMFITGSIKNVKPATQAQHGPSFDFVIDEPASSRGVVIAYELFAFSMADTISEPWLASFEGRKVRLRVRKSDLTEASPEIVQLRTSTSLAIHAL